MTEKKPLDEAKTRKIPCCKRDWNHDGDCDRHPNGIVLDEAKTRTVLADVLEERRRQHEKWGQQDLPDASPATIGLYSRTAAWVRGQAENALWFDANPDARRDNFGSDEQHFAWPLVLFEEVAEAYEESEREVIDPAKLRAELVQVAAVAVQWIEAIDRRTEPGRFVPEKDDREIVPLGDARCDRPTKAPEMFEDIEYSVGGLTEPEGSDQ